MTFAEKIVRLRKIKKITQDELACAVGVSRQAVYKWESAQSYPEVAKLLEIKLLFNVSIDDLLDDTFDIALPEKKRKKRGPKPKAKVAIEDADFVEVEVYVDENGNEVELADDEVYEDIEVYIDENGNEVEAPV